MAFKFDINGVAMPTPAHKGFSVQLSDIDSPATDRNAKGRMRRERVRSNVVRIDVKYNHMSMANYKKIINAISPTFFDVTYYDINAGKNITKRMYAGDIKYDHYTADMVEGLTFALIEG